MPTTRSRGEIVAAIHDELDALLTLGRELSPDDWSAPTACPGWSVQDNYAHVLGTESMLLGRPQPQVEVGDPAHVHNDIARFNEAWVEAWRARPPAELLAELQAVASDRYAALDALSDEEWDAVGFTPAGQDTHGRFMQIRVFDCWIHEQDVREAVGRPGHESGLAAEVAVDEMSTAMGFVFGKKAGATEGQSLRLVLTGGVERTVHVRVDGRATVVPHVDDPTVTVTLPAALWFRFAAGRAPGDPDHPGVRIDGDVDLGRRLVTNAAYTI